MISRFYLTVFEFYLTVSTSYLTNPNFLRLSLKEKDILLESSPHRGLPSGRECRPIFADSGLTRIGGILSVDFGRVSNVFAYLSYGFRVLSYGFRFLSDEPQCPLTLIERKGHLIGKQPASRTAQWAGMPPDPFN